MKSEHILNSLSDYFIGKLLNFTHNVGLENILGWVNYIYLTHLCKIFILPD